MQAVDGRAELARRAAQLGVVRASELRRGSGPVPVPEGYDGPVPVAGVSGGPEPAPAADDGGPAGGPGSSGPGSSGPGSSGPGSSAPLPVSAPLAGLLPSGGLRRGTAVAVGGSERSGGSLVLGLLAEASRAGSWCALVGLPGLGMAAAAEAGLDLARTALVPRPGPRPAPVVAALVDGVDVVVLGGAAGWSAGDRQRLTARVRQRGAVLVAVVPRPGAWPGAEVELHATGGVWSGLEGDGAGRLRGRRVHLRCSARGRAHLRRADALLPGPDGRLAPVEVGAAEQGAPAAGGRATVTAV